MAPVIESQEHCRIQRKNGKSYAYQHRIRHHPRLHTIGIPRSTVNIRRCCDSRPISVVKVYVLHCDDPHILKGVRRIVTKMILHLADPSPP
jgi:hypothetical protein